MQHGWMHCPSTPMSQRPLPLERGSAADTRRPRRQRGRHVLPGRAETVTVSAGTRGRLRKADHPTHRDAAQRSRLLVVARTRSAALPAGKPYPVGSTGLGRRQRVEGAARHYLLTGDGTFRAPAADEADRPVKQRGDALLEADQVEQVDYQPEQPGDEPGETEPADAGYGGKPRDRRHAPLVDILEGFV